MSKNSTIPDAWDDDWESQADKADALAEAQKVEEQVKVTKAQRAAKHAEENKKIWESAETPETFHFLAARDTVPFKTEFKPALKVLSRKPTPKVVARHDPVTGVSQMTIEDDDDEEEDKKDQPTPEELKLKSQRDREERERKYYEARARIMGTPTTSGSVTPPNTTEEGRSNRSKGRGRGGRQENVRPSSQSGTKELFDPNYTAKPASAVSIQKRNGTPSSSGKSTPRDEEQVIRSPKGPDGSGRAGFGFANRGGKTG